MYSFLRVVLAAIAFAALWEARAEIITRLPTDEKVVALTLDACEAGKVTHLDHGVADWLIANEVPFTIFMGGRFARDNAEDVAKLGALPFVEIENHSWSHPADMRKLSTAEVMRQVFFAGLEVGLKSGRATRFFRFPGGNADARTIAAVEAMGYQIVHWRWPSGDPDKGIPAKKLESYSLSATKQGDVLIFHINGNGVHTAEALPAIVEGLKAKGYRFVLLQDYLPPVTR
ncbi:MAG: polysaccharide deacetylase family protein [Micropepsaceae bacterium]